nr:TatD family hydrolase [uncultured Fusobacterium sp.]
MKIIDSHVHLNSERFDEDRDEVLKRIEENLDFVVNIGYDLESSEISVDYANKYSFVYATIGFHPDEIEGYSDEAEKKLEELAKNKKVLAIGEIGLDYHWMTRPKEEQWEIFRRQLRLARKLNKPVVIHTREAMEDTINILNEFPDITGILHCYPGSVETAKRMIDRFYLGIGGVLTFKNARKLIDVVTDIPIEKLVIETDCPYMAPTPYRGQRNEPIYTEEVAKKIAELKNISYDEVVRITNENTRKAYRML